MSGATTGGPDLDADPGAASPAPAGRRLTADARRRQLFEVALTLFYQHFESKRALYLELMDVFSKELVTRIVEATATAAGPRQQVELGFAAYFDQMVRNEKAFRLLYGRDAPDDLELGAALRRVEETIAQAIDPLIDAGLDPGHRLLLAHSVVGMAEGASRHWLDTSRKKGGLRAGGDEAQPAS